MWACLETPVQNFVLTSVVRLQFIPLLLYSQGWWPWLLSLNLQPEFQGSLWAYNWTVLVKEPVRDRTTQVHCCEHNCLFCHSASQTLWLLTATHCLHSSVVWHCHPHCLESIDADVHAFWIPSFTNNKLPSWRQTWWIVQPDFLRPSILFLARCFLKGQKLSKLLLPPAYERAKTSSKTPTVRGPRFLPLYFLLFLDTISLLHLQSCFSSMRFFIMRVRCSLRFQELVHVLLHLWMGNA